MGLKVFSITEFLISHILLIGGLVLVTVGIIQHLTTIGLALIIAGMWVGALGLCIGFSAAFKKLLAK